MLKDKGQLKDADLFNVFNMGIGFVLALPADQARRAIEIAAENGEDAFVIGQVIGGEGVVYKGNHDGSLRNEEA